MSKVPKIEMVKVPEGSFWMGSCDDYLNNQIEKIFVPKFMIGKYPVTQELWESVMGHNIRYFEGNDLPVETVSWRTAQIFINQLNFLSRRKYRLPTDYEWEYSYKGAGRDPFYGEYNIDEIAWIESNSRGKTHEVGLKKPNILGIYDMLGNVWEWTQNNKSQRSNYTKNKELTDEELPVNYIGGSWRMYDGLFDTPCPKQTKYKQYSSNDVGFRLCMDY